MDMKWFLFSFEGRINRKPFWMFVLAFVVVVGLVQLATGDVDSRQTSVPTTILCLLLLWPSLAVQAKRWHDTDRSAWWILIGLVPIIGGLWALIVTGFFAGTQGSNRFGPDPLSPAG